MPLVNHTLKNLAGGVSQQFEESRFEVQVAEMINCVPSISRGILRRNPVTNGVLLSSSLDSSDYYVYTYNRGTGTEQYTMFIGNGSWYVFNATTKALISNGTSSYLNLPVGATPKEAFSLVTIGDFTYIANKYITTALSATVDGTANSHKTTGIYWIKRTSQVQTTSITTGATTSTQSTGVTMEGYKYGLNGQEVFAVKNTTGSSYTVGGVTYSAGTDLLRGEQLASSLAGKLGYSTYGTYVYKTGMSSSDTWTWYDSAGNEASFGFKGEVERSDMLPTEMPSALTNTLVNITLGTSNPQDDYWLKYTGSTWTEDRKPGMQNTLAPNTMPHVLVRGSDNEFYFIEYTTSAIATVPGATGEGWLARTVGDEDSAPVPSFIGQGINQIFFHKNRLGIISKDSITLSENGTYGNFFPTTVRTIPDTDPIDLTIASTDIALIHSAVSTNYALVLFSDNSQYVLSSGQGTLTPVTANIEVVSRYNCSNKCKPRAIGNKVYFVSESGGYSQLFIYNVQEGYQITEANQVSLHVPSYLPKNIRYITGHSVLGYNFLWSEDTPNIIYVYNMAIVGGQLAQSAFHKWEFSYDIIGLSIINNNLSITFRNSATNSYYIGDITLEISGTPELLTYTDTINSNTFNYDSSVEFSKWLIKDNSGNGTKVGRLQISTVQYTTSTNSQFSTYVVNNNGVITADIGLWTDDGIWNDTETWTDSVPYYTVITDNKNKVSVMSNSFTTNIIFKQNRNTPTAGFVLSTVNYEGFFHTRSQRF